MISRIKPALITLREVTTLDKLTENLVRRGEFRESLTIVGVEPDNDVTNLAESTKKTSTELPESIIVTVEAIHAGMTKNKTFYPANQLEASTHTWTTPYNKPVIKNHDHWEEPNGRVIEANFKQSVLKPDTHTIELKLKIMDEDTIKKVLSGQYLTLSIGGSTNSAKCSICGKNIVTEGWCGHSKGRIYDGKEAYWIIGEMEFDEISWVNVPADVNAQVISVQVPKEASGGRRSESVAGEQNPTPTETPAAVSVTEGLSEVDNLLDLNEGQEETPGTQEEQTPETGAQQEGAPEGEQPNSEQQEGVNPEKTPEERIAEMEQTIAQLTQERDTLKADKDALQASLDAANATIAERDQELVTVREERDTFRNKNITLAKTAHRIMAERAVDLRIVLGEAKKEEREGLLADYAKTPAKVLEATIKDLLDKPAITPVQPRESKPLTPEGAAEPGSLEEGDITESASSTKEPAPQLTIEDLANSIVKVIKKRGSFE
jgi:hypothetical protein